MGKLMKRVGKVFLPLAAITGTGIALYLWYVIRISHDSSEPEEDDIDRDLIPNEESSCGHDDLDHDNDREENYIPPVNEPEASPQATINQLTTNSNQNTNYDRNNDNPTDLSDFMESNHTFPFIEVILHDETNIIEEPVVALPLEIMDCFSQLPEDCRCKVILFTSPKDAFRLSLLFPSFRSASDSDTVWECFLQRSDLPANVWDVLNDIQDWKSRKELYFYLCDNPVLLEVDGNMNMMSLSLDRASGAKVYMLCARALTIAHSDDPVQFWRWVQRHDSRFSEVAELDKVWAFLISGNFESNNLSPRTNYAVYLVFKTTKNSKNLDKPQKAILSVGTLAESNQTICLKPTKRPYQNVIFPQARRDGWMEIELGEFYNDDGENGPVKIKLSEISNNLRKTGLIVEGIEIRPKQPAT